MSKDIEIDPELLAEIEDSEPDFIVSPDGLAPWWFEMAHAACATLGLDELHREHCLEPNSRDEDAIEKMAVSAEQMLTALRLWLREHGVPKLAFGFSCISAGGAWYFAEIKGTESGRYTDEPESED